MKPRRLHIVFATLLIGVFVWLSVNLSEQYQITLETPLTIEGIPEGMAIRTAVPRNLQLRFRGDGWRLAALMLGSIPHLRIPLAHCRRRIPVFRLIIFWTALRLPRVSS